MAISLTLLAVACAPGEAPGRSPAEQAAPADGDHPSPPPLSSTGEPPTAPASSPAPSYEADPAAIDYASAIGVDMAEASRRAALLEAAQPTLDAIREEAGDTVAGMYIEHLPDLLVHLRLTADPTPALQSIIDQSPMPIVVVTDAPFSRVDMQRRLDLEREWLREAVPWLNGTWIDERTGEVVLDVFLYGSPKDISAAKSGVEEAAATLRQKTGLPVRVEYDSAPLEPDLGQEGTAGGPADGPVLPLLPPSSGGLMALLSGELVVEDHCLYVIDEHGDRWLPLLPAGIVSWESGALTVHGERFEPGEEISLGGGEASKGRLERLQLLQEPHDSCDTRNVWIAYLGASR